MSSNENAPISRGKAGSLLEPSSEGKGTKEALQEAYGIINRSPAVVFLWRNAEGWPVAFVSDNVARVLGYNPQDFLSGKQNYAELIHPEDLDQVSREVMEYSREAAREAFVHKPYRIRIPSGEIRWVDDRTVIRRDDQGRITHYQGIILDITEKVAAQDRLEKTLHELRERNKELRCLYRMARVLEKKDVGLKDILHETADIIPPAWQHPEATFARIRYKGYDCTSDPFRESSWKQEAPIRVRGVRSGTVEVFVLPPQTAARSLESPFLPEEKDLLDAIADEIGRAVEHIEAEEALRENESHYRNLVENLGEIVFSMDSQGLLTYVSPMIHDFFGFEVPEVLGRPFTEFVPTEELSERKTRFEEILSGRSTVSEFRLKAREGTLRWVRASTRPLRKNRQIVGVQGLLVDITDQKKAQKEKEARERLRGVIETAGAVCHELNQPLQALIGYADLLQMELNSPSAVQRYAKKIRDQVLHLSTITKKLETIDRYSSKDYLGSSRIIDIERSTSMTAGDPAPVKPHTTKNSKPS